MQVLQQLHEAVDDVADVAVGSLSDADLLCRRHHVLWHEGRLRLAELRVPWLRTPLDPPMVA